MNTAEIEKIVDNRVKFLSETVNYFASEKDTMSSAEVSRYLNKSIRWVQLNKDILGGERKNRAMHLRFDTAKVLEYKRNE